MRRGYVFLGFSLIGLCGAVALPARQEPPKAEAVFKNIVSLKGENASDVIPSMQFMCASLKVECAFCHTADRASDEIRAKGTTRAMIAMQRDINKKNFNGRNQVTCATCHGGHERPMNLPPVTGIEVRAQRSQDVKPEEVLAAYAKAVGGDPTHPISGLRFNGTATSNGVKTPFEATYAAGKFTLVTKLPKGDQKQGFNGSSAWFTTEKGVQKIPMQYASHFLNMKAIFIGPDSLPKLASTTGGTATLDGKADLVVTGTLADKTRVSLYFDKQTGLLSRTVYTYPTILGSMAQINDFTNYRKVGGVQIAMTITNHATEGDTLLQYRSAKTDDKIDPTFFDPPSN